MFFEKLPFWGQKMIFTPKQKLFQKHGFWRNGGRYSYNKDAETENALSGPSECIFN